MQFLLCLLVSISSVFSGSVHFSDLVLNWHYEQVFIKFSVTFTVPSPKPIDWWSVSIGQELDHRIDVFLFNNTGLDGRFVLSDCTNDLELISHESSETSFITEFRRPLNATEGCYVTLVPGSEYLVTVATGVYLGDDLIEHPDPVPAKSIIMTNQFTDEETMSATLNYVMGVSGFIGFLYIAA
jgi:hypothetical protein